MKGTSKDYPVKRRYERYTSGEPIYASLTHMPGRLCRIRDISIGGVGLECTDLQNSQYDERRKNQFMVNIFLPGTNERILGVPYELVHATKVKSFNPSFMGNTATRMGLKFVTLSEEQSRALASFLDAHCERLGF